MIKNIIKKISAILTSVILHVKNLVRTKHNLFHSEVNEEFDEEFVHEEEILPNAIVQPPSKWVKKPFWKHKRKYAVKKVSMAQGNNSYINLIKHQELMKEIDGRDNQILKN